MDLEAWQSIYSASSVATTLHLNSGVKDSLDTKLKVSGENASV